MMAEPTIDTMRSATMTKAKTLRTMCGRMLWLFYWDVVFRSVYYELTLGKIDGYESRVSGSGNDTEIFYVLVEFVRPFLDVGKGNGAGEYLDFRASELRGERRRIESLRGHLIERVLIEKIFSFEFEYEGRSFSGHSLPNSGKVDIPRAVRDFRVNICDADGKSRNDVVEVLLDEVLLDEDEGPRIHSARGRGFQRFGVSTGGERRTIAQVRIDEVVREDVDLVSRIFG